MTKYQGNVDVKVKSIIALNARHPYILSVGMANHNLLTFSENTVFV